MNKPFSVVNAGHSSDDYDDDDYEEESSLSLSFGDRVLARASTELEFGFVEASTLAELNDSNVDHRSRIKAIETIQKKLSLLTDVSLLEPHLASLVQYLGKMLNDKNFTILLTTLQILGELVKKVGKPINGHLRYILPRLISKFGDNKLVIRQMNMKLFNVLLQYLTPAPVMTMLIGSTAHENWHVRKQVVNCITVALLTYPQYAFDYSRLVRVLACVLNDPKAKVRNCAADALSVVHRNIDGKLFSIIDEINNREEEESGAALVTSTQLRSLKQRLLNGNSMPIARSDGSVESSYTPDDSHHNVAPPASSQGPSTSSSSSSTPSLSAYPRRPLSSSNNALGEHGNGQSLPRHPSASSKARRIPFPVSVPDGMVLNGGGHSSTRGSHSVDLKQHQRPSYDEPQSAPSSSSSHSYFPSFRPDGPADDSLYRNNSPRYLANQSPTVSPPPSKAVLSASPVFEQRATTPSRGKKSVKFSNRLPVSSASGLSASADPYLVNAPKASVHVRSHSIHDQGLDAIGLHEEKLNLWLALDESPYSRGGGNFTPALDDPDQQNLFRSFHSSSSGYEHQNRERDAGPVSAHSADFHGGNMLLRGPDYQRQARGVSSSGSMRPSRGNRRQEHQERPRTEHAHIKSKLKNLKLRSRGESRNGRAGSAHAGLRAVSRSVDSVSTLHEQRENSFSRNMNEAGFSDMPQYVPAQRPIRGLSQSVTGKPSITMKSAAKRTSNSYNGPLSKGGGMQRGGSGRPSNYRGGRRGSHNAMDPPQEPMAASPRRELPHFQDRQQAPAAYGEKPLTSHEETTLRGGGAFDPDVHYGDDFDPFGGKKSRSSSARRALPSGPKKSPSIKVGSSAQLSQQRMQRRKQTHKQPAHAQARSPGHSRSFSSPLDDEDEKDLSRPPSHARASSVTETEETFLHSDELVPLDRPRVSCKSALAGLKSLDWKQRFDALTTLRQLTVHHTSNVVDVGVRAFAKDLVSEVDSLRSLIAKNAIALCTDLFRNLGRAIDNDAHVFLSSLIKRAYESNIFLLKEANCALQALIEGLSESKVLSLLLTVAAGEKKGPRVVVANLLNNALVFIGPSVLQVRDYKSVVRAVGSFCVGRDEEMRLHGKACILTLSQYAGQLEFEKQCKMMLPTAQYSAVKKMMERGLSLNLGRPSSTLGRNGDSVRSNRKRSTVHGRNSSMAPPRVARDELDSPMSVQGNSVSPSSSRLPSRQGERMRSEEPSSRGRSGRKPSSPASRRATLSRQSTLVGEEDQEVLNSVYSCLDSSDWRQRLEGLGRILNLRTENPKLFEDRGVHLFSKLADRLSDNNKKVNLEALRTLQAMIPVSQAALPGALQGIVRPLVANLAQSSEQVKQITLDCLDQIMACVEAKVVGPVLCNTALFGHTRVKAAVLGKISDLVPSMYAESVRVVTKHVVSLAFQTLGESNKDLVRANTRLLRELHGVLGPGLLDSHLTNRLTPAALVKLKVMLR